MKPSKAARRLVASLFLPLLLSSFALAFFSSPAHAQGEGGEGTAIVAKVDGLLNDIVADFIEESIENAENENAVVLVFQVDSSIALISDSRLGELAGLIHKSDIPIAVWVGPGNARVRGKVAQLISVADELGIAPGSRVGDTGENILPAELPVPFGGSLQNSSVGYDDAEEAGVVRFDSPTIGDLLLNMEGFGFESQEVLNEETGIIHREPVTKVRFTRLSLLDQAMHTIASPPVVYLLFSFGLALLVLEYYTAGVGISGVIGATCFVLGCYGLVVLPVNIWGVLLIAFGVFGYAVDVQTGVLRFWTFAGTGLFVAGTFTLFTDGVSLSWIPITGGVAGMIAGMAWALPILVRTRFSTPTIGREWMVGESGTAVEDVNPEGVVLIKGALWRARATRASKIREGSAIKVLEIDRMLLEVEPVVTPQSDN